MQQVFLTPQHLAIVMEHAAGGDMFQYLVRRQALSEAEARWCFQQLIIAIDYCHRVVSPGSPAQHAVLLISALISSCCHHC